MADTVKARYSPVAVRLGPDSTCSANISAPSMLRRSRADAAHCFPAGSSASAALDAAEFTTHRALLVLPDHAGSLHDTFDRVCDDYTRPTRASRASSARRPRVMLSVSAVGVEPSALQDRALHTEGIISQVDDVRGALRARLPSYRRAGAGIAADTAADRLDREHEHSRAILDGFPTTSPPSCARVFGLPCRCASSRDEFPTPSAPPSPSTNRGPPGPGWTFLAHVAADTTAHHRIIRRPCASSARSTTTAHDESVGVSPESPGRLRVPGVTHPESGSAATGR